LAKTFSVQGVFDKSMMGKLIEYLQKYRRLHSDHEDLFLLMLSFDENSEEHSVERKVAPMLLRVVMANMSYKQYLYTWFN